MPRPSPLPSASRWRADQGRGEHHDHCSPCAPRLLTPPTRTPSSWPSVRTELSRFILLCVNVYKVTLHMEHKFQLFSNKIFMKCVRSKLDIMMQQVSHVTSSASLQMYCHLQIGTVEAYGRQNLYGWMGFPHRMLIITVLCRSSLGYKTSTGAVLHLLSQLQIRC